MLCHGVQPHKGHERIYFTVNVDLCYNGLTSYLVIASRLVAWWILFLMCVWNGELPSHPLYFWPSHIIRRHISYLSFSLNIKKVFFKKIYLENSAVAVRVLSWVHHFSFPLLWEPHVSDRAGSFTLHPRRIHGLEPQLTHKEHLIWARIKPLFGKPLRFEGHLLPQHNLLRADRYIWSLQ